MTIQKSKMDNFIEQYLDTYKEKVEKEFNVEGVPEDQVAGRKFEKLQDLLGRDPAIAEKLHADVIKKLIYKEPCFENPWK